MQYDYAGKNLWTVRTRKCMCVLYWGLQQSYLGKSFYLSDVGVIPVREEKLLDLFYFSPGSCDHGTMN